MQLHMKESRVPSESPTFVLQLQDDEQRMWLAHSAALPFKARAVRFYLVCVTCGVVPTRDGSHEGLCVWVVYSANGYRCRK